MLKALDFQPGVDRENTATSVEGRWVQSNNVRFRAGTPEKIGGWQDDGAKLNSGGLAPTTGTFWGICRSLFSWLTLANYSLLGLGTSQKYYIQFGAGGGLYDVTPLRNTTAAGDVTFAATNGSTTLTVTDTAHGASVGDFVTFSGVVGLGGAITATVLNTEFKVATVIDNNTYTVTSPVAATAGDVGNGGAAVVGAYQISIGSDLSVSTSGWGTGGWGGVNKKPPTTGWGQSVGGDASGDLRLWSAGNFGERLIINPLNGPLYVWQPDTNPFVFNRATLLSVTDAPLYCRAVLISDASRFVLAFGVNDYGSTVQDPMLVRWSAQENYNSWTPSATNQAGSYRLSRGSQIVAATQTKQEVLVFTDTALYSMQYLGPPFVWGTTILADNISIISPNAAISVNNITYWMGVDKFYVYNGRVEPLPCTLRSFIFDRLNRMQSYQVFAGLNSAFNEVWWFYCSGTSVWPDSYVIYNYAENTWAFGSMTRTAWIGSKLRPTPVATTANNVVVQHEVGTDDATLSTVQPINAYVESAPVDIDDGNSFSFVRRMLPDVSFDGSSVDKPELALTLKAFRAPGSGYVVTDSRNVASTQNYTAAPTYLVQQFTEAIYPRIRGRQLSFRIESTGIGVNWQLGKPRIEIRTDGRA